MGFNLLALALASALSGASAAESWGEPAKEAAASLPAVEQIEVLSGDISRPEDFKRYVEGSRQQAGAPVEPAASAPQVALQAGPPVRLKPPGPGQEPRRSDVPSLHAVASRRAARDAGRSLGVPQGMAAGAVMLLGLLAWGAWRKPELAAVPEWTPNPAYQEPAVEALSATSPAQSALRAPAVPTGPSRRSTFIDTRMPVSTWRAISLPEQLLIDRWDASREKALGLASLDEWIDAKGAAAGVDVRLLKMKLYREA